MAESFTHKYIPRIEQREKNLFVEEYYSSTDVKIILDGVEQTEIGYISYALQEQLKPLYGYASRTYDDVAIGNRIVTGAFKVPIKNPEGQTQLEEIIQAQSGGTPEESPDDFNTEQDKAQNAIEWIDSGIRDVVTGGGSTFHPDVNDVNNEKYIYINKMQDLGLKDRYGNKITMQSSEESVKSAIQKLQSENGNLDDSTGELTEQTKELIDSMIFAQWSTQETITLHAGYKVYIGPGTDYSYSTLYSNQEAIVVDKSLGDWWQIELVNGNMGWIEATGGDSNA